MMSLDDRKVTIIDSKVSNLKSICNALNFLQIPFVVTQDLNVIENSKKLILPGVGHIKEFTNNIEKSEINKALKNYLSDDKNFFLGICVGMQYLFEKSDENLESNGLGFFKGIVKKFTNTKEHHTIPNIGKNVLSRSLLKWPGTIFDINIEKPEVYFLHSYFCKVEKKYELTKSEYNEIVFTSSIKKNNIYGVQFHPEKSGQTGLKILKKFYSL